MTDFDEILAAEGGRKLRLMFTIDGVDRVFQESSTTEPYALFSVNRLKVIQSIEVGESSIDLERRRMVGGSMRAVLVDDGTLDALFASRTRSLTHVTSTASTAATTINVQTTSGFPSSGVIHIGAETIAYAAITATSFTTCTRAQFGTQAQTHYGDTERGAKVFAQPPSWVGRRVRLQAYFETDSPDRDALSSPYDVDTFRLEEAPVYLGNDRWELRCSHLSDEVAARQLGVGLRKVDAVAIRPEFNNTTSQLEWRTRGAVNLFPSSTTGYYPTSVAVTYDDGSGELLRFQGKAGASVDGDIIATDLTGLLAPGSAITAASDARAGRVFPQTFEHWAILGGGNIGQLACFALASVLGDGANGANDVLPGCVRASAGQAGDEARFGAGIRAAELDDSAFVSVANQVVPAWSFVIKDQVSVEDFLSDWCLAAEAFWFVNRTGLLTVQTVAEQRVAVARTLSANDVIGEPLLEVTEDDIYPRATMRLSLSPWSGDYLDSVTMIDEEMAARHVNREDVLTIESRGLCISPAGTNRPTCSRTDIEMLMRRRMVNDGRGRLFITMDAPITCLTLDLGDIVSIGFTGLPDYEGGDLNGRRARIVARRPDLERGVVRLRLQVLETLYAIAPAAIISSVVGNTLNLRTVGPEVASASPGNMFAAGWTIELCRASGGTATATILSVTATSVTLTAAPPAGIVAGADFIRAAYSATTTASVDGYIPSEFTYQQQATGGPPTTRWR